MTLYCLAMIPFLHVWPLPWPIPTFGLMVACAMLAAYFVLRADLARRGIADKTAGEAEALISFPCLAGFAGAKLLPSAGIPGGVFRGSAAVAFQPLRVRVVRRSASRIRHVCVRGLAHHRRATRADGQPRQSSPFSMPARRPRRWATASAASAACFPATATTAYPLRCPGA